MYAGCVQLDRLADPTTVADRLVSALRQARASSVAVDDHHIRFVGGLFRMVSNWNVLGLFDSGELYVDAAGRRVTYRLRFVELLVVATGMITFMGAAILIVSGFKTLIILPFMWLLLVGGNLAIGIPRFHYLVKRATRVG